MVMNRICFQAFVSNFKESGFSSLSHSAVEVLSYSPAASCRGIKPISENHGDVMNTEADMNEDRRPIKLLSER